MPSTKHHSKPPHRKPPEDPNADPYSRLTPKQQAFVDYYLACGNATEAAERAGYTGNRSSLKVGAFETLHKPHIQAAIQIRRNSMQSTRILNAQEIQERLSAIACDETQRTKDRISALTVLAKIKIPELRQRDHSHDIGDKTRDTVTAWIASVLGAHRRRDSGSASPPGGSGVLRGGDSPSNTLE